MQRAPVSLSAFIRQLRGDLEQSEGPIRSQMILAWDDAIAAFELDLWAVTELIEDARLAGLPVSPSWLYQQDRYKEMLRHATAEIERFQNQTANPLLDTMIKRGTAEGADTGMDLLNRAGITSAFGSRPNTRAIDTLYQMMTGSESPVRDVIDQYGPHVAGVIRHRMGQGLIQGHNPREVVRGIMGELTGNANRARISTLIRTEHMRAVRLASAEMYKQYDHAINGFRWVSAHQVRTCLGCLAIDGQVFDSAEKLMMHPNCRCVLVPIGKYTPPEYKYETGAEWFARQSESTQRAMMPSRAAFDAYRDGRLPFNRFIGMRNDPVWGISIYERSGIEAMRAAGIDVRKPTPKAPPKPPVEPKQPDGRMPKAGFASRDEAIEWYSKHNFRLAMPPSLSDAELETINTVSSIIDRDMAAGRAVPRYVSFSHNRKGNSIATATYSPYPEDRKVEFRLHMMTPDNVNAQARLAAARERRGGAPWTYGGGSIESTVVHELGHIRHYANMTSVSHQRGKGFVATMNNGSEVRWSSWVGYNTKRWKAVRAKVSEYGQSVPMEFIAEVYAGDKIGITFDADVWELYDLLGGPRD